MAGLLSRRKRERAGFELYGQAVAAARDPHIYAVIGAPDTLDGRFDLIGLYAFLVIRRLRKLDAAGPALAQAVFDAMFSDMDLNLREIGVGDLSVGKKVKLMWEAFHGRAAAYQDALEANDRAALEAALARNVWRGAAPEGAAAALARLVLAQEACLVAQEPVSLLAGRVQLLPAAEAAANPSAAQAAANPPAAQAAANPPAAQAAAPL